MRPVFQRGVAAILWRIFLAVFLSLAANGAAADVSTPSPAAVKVNRTAPSVKPPSSDFSLPDPASTEDLRQARLFAEPLTPAGGTPTAGDNAALAAVLRTYAAGKDPGALEAYVQANPASPWAAGVLTNLGLLKFQQGYFSAALGDWRQAWDAGKDAQDAAGQAMANRAAAELIRMYCRVGRQSEAEGLLAETSGRSFRGRTANMMAESRQAVKIMERQPANCFKCGPYALRRILMFSKRATAENTALIAAYATTAQGASLAQVADLAARAGLSMQAARRTPGAAIPLPAVVNWKLNHYGALLWVDGNRYLLADPTFGAPQWVLKDAVEQEASGYFLIPSGALPQGWSAVSKEEAGTVWGKGLTSGQNGNACTPCDQQTGCPQCHGMAVWNIHMMLDSLHIYDTPLAYHPPVGPAVEFRLNYDAKEQNQPSTIHYGNFGPLWNFSWESSITFDSANAYVALGGGGTEVFTGFSTQTQSYAMDIQSECTLVKISSTNYELRAADGSKNVFALADSSGRIYLTAVTDAYGNSATLTYDSNFRLVAVTDALGQVSTLVYGSNTVGNSAFYLVAKITDPFGRFTTFGYNGSGQLTKITDEIGISSQFVYGGNDFIQTLTTPYGATSFSYNVTIDGNTQTLIATEPSGAQQRVDAVETSTVTPSSDPPATVPSGAVFDNNGHLQYRNSYYWNREAMQTGAGDYTKARLFHFLHDATNGSLVGSLLESTKAPLENRVWYRYEGQNYPNYMNAGMLSSATVVARVVDSGSTQLYQAAYNSQAYPTQQIDPVGRTTNYTYAANGMDVLTVSQVTSGTASDLLASYTWNAQHEPLTYTDAAGKTTTYTYNAAGQLTSVTDAAGATTTLTYTGGYLTSVSGPLAGDTGQLTLVYDSYGRIQKVTDADGYALSCTYDNLDRPLTVTYPDGTTEQNIYTNLDLTLHKDRLNHWTRSFYDSNRQLIAMEDPAGLVTNFSRCVCGALNAMIDANGNKTSWTWDLEGRITAKIYADNSATHYTYSTTTSRLASMTDAKGQVTSYAYNLDDTIKNVVYTNAVIPTQGVAFAYDPYYKRLLSFTDGLGTTSYTYAPASTLGAGKVASVIGPLANSTVAYQYDALGRLATRTINGSANSLSVAYDAIGRPTTVTNVLGAFTTSYVGNTRRIQSVAFPNGQTTQFSYLGNSGDKRLADISNYVGAIGSSILSKFDYTYDSLGDITQWTQQADSNAPTTWAYGYDQVSQLLNAVKKDANGNLLSQYNYAYDHAGNRVSAQTNGTVLTTGFNNLNQGGAQTAGGSLLWQGHANKALYSVTLNGQAATLTGSSTFSGSVPVVAGTNTVQVVVTDTSANVTTKNYQTVIPAGSASAPVYDLDGNQTQDASGNTYAWDAKNELVQITYSGGDKSQFSYDGLGRRASIIETGSGGAITSTKQFVFDGLNPAEERDASNNVTKRFFGQGEQIAGASYYYTRDHLGSIREMTNGSGVIQARYDYDPYGVVSAVGTVTLASDFQYAGYYEHGPSGLNLPTFRPYGTNSGRWPSRDPIGEDGGINLYTYVSNNTINAIDPLGLFAGVPAGVAAYAASGGGAAEGARRCCGGRCRSSSSGRYCYSWCKLCSRLWYRKFDCRSNCEFYLS